MSTAAVKARPTPPALVVAAQELRDLWLTGRGVPLALAFTVLLGVTTYLVASNQGLNFLEQREAVSLTLQVAVAVGALLALLVSADAISGERERGTLETLLLSPAPRWALVTGKGVAALSVWAACFALSVPYVWYLSRGADVLATALLAGIAVGALLAVLLVALGLLISAFATSNRFSLALGLFALLALYAPTQFPSGARKGRAGELLERIDPLSAGLHYLDGLVVRAHGAGDEIGWLISPAVAAGLVAACTVAAARRLALRGRAP